MYRAENFRIVDFEINHWSPLFINLKINLNFQFVFWKVYKIQPIEWRMQDPEQPIKKQEIWNFTRHLMKELLLVGIW